MIKLTKDGTIMALEKCELEITLVRGGAITQEKSVRISRTNLARVWDSLKYNVLKSDKSSIFEDLCKGIGL